MQKWFTHMALQQCLSPKLVVVNDASVGSTVKHRLKVVYDITCVLARLCVHVV